MKKIRTLRVTFNLECKFDELQEFRKSVAKQAGYENILFHNHKEDNELRYGYPLIQYKIIRKKASLLCFEEGVNEIEAFFRNGSLKIDWKGNPIDLNLDYIGASLFTLNVVDTEFLYSMKNWKALNGKNYQEFQKLESRQHQLALLERILTGNILSMAKGLGYQIERKITIKILRINSHHPQKYKGIDFHIFNLDFQTNTFMPDFAGLGKSSSLGYGMIFRIKTEPALDKKINNCIN